jgi:tetratricopeptide (TPR) repeat protein
MKLANGPDHLDPILADGNLAQVRVARGDLDGAAAILRELIPHTKRALTAEHPAYPVFCMRLGDILARQGKWAEAEPFLADAYAGARAQGIPPRIAMAASSYGLCLAKQKKYDQADAPLREAHEHMPLLPEAQRGAHPAVLAALVEVAEHRRNADDVTRWRAALAALPSSSPPTTATTAPAAR